MLELAEDNILGVSSPHDVPYHERQTRACDTVRNWTPVILACVRDMWRKPRGRFGRGLPPSVRRVLDLGGDDAGT